MKLLAQIMLAVSLGFTVLAHADKREVRSDVLKVLLEMSPQISVGGIPLAQYLAERMALPRGESYPQSLFNNVCDKSTTDGELKCKLSIGSSQMMMAPGPGGAKWERVHTKDEFLGYRIKADQNGVITILDRNLKVTTW